MSKNKIPTHLNHKPIIGVDYKNIDKAAGYGDGEFLSIGRSQWNPEDVSAKVIRWTGDKWSRQSEELTLSRVLDLAKLTIAQITGQKSSLNESVINENDVEFLNSFITENMDLYQSKISELKDLLSMNNISINNAEGVPNIFSFATSELSQDAIIAWIISWADDKYLNIDNDLCQTGKSFLSLLTGLRNQDIHTVNVGRQWNNIDIWVELNSDSFITIEDKTGTSIHDDQLIRYKDIVEETYAGVRDRLFFVYIKTENEPISTLKTVEQQGYRTIKRDDILSVLNTYKGENVLLNDFRKHLQSIENDTNSYRHLPVDKWSGYAWQGFYKELEKYIDVDSWGYVNNPSGGFIGMWWNWQSNEEEDVTMYLQFEQAKLCIKICYEGETNRSEIRNKYMIRLMNESQKSGLHVERPTRLGAGTYMTIGVLPKDFIFGNQAIDIKNIITKLRLCEDVIAKTVVHKE